MCKQLMFMASVIRLDRFLGANLGSPLVGEGLAWKSQAKQRKRLAANQQSIHMRKYPLHGVLRLLPQALLENSVTDALGHGRHYWRIPRSTQTQDTLAHDTQQDV